MDDAQVAVGQLFQFVATVSQIPGGPALGEQQRQHMPVGVRLGSGGGGVVGSATQQLVGLTQIHAEPGPQAVAEAVHLAETGAAGQRRGIEVVQNDALAGAPGIWAVPVGPQAGMHHLAQLVAGIPRRSLGRVAVLFRLRCQRAAPVGAQFRPDGLYRLHGDGAAEPPPLDCGVLVRVSGTQQLAVLNEQQGVSDQRGNVVKTVEDLTRVARRVQRYAIGAGDGQSGSRFLVVDGVAAVLRELQQLGRKAGLPLQLIAACLGGGDALRQLAVTKALVVRSGFGIHDAVAGAVFQTPGEEGVPMGKDMRLQHGLTHLDVRCDSGDHQDKGE